MQTKLCFIFPQSFLRAKFYIVPISHFHPTPCVHSLLWYYYKWHASREIYFRKSMENKNKIWVYYHPPHKVKFPCAQLWPQSNPGIPGPRLLVCKWRVWIAWHWSSSPQIPGYHRHQETAAPVLAHHPLFIHKATYSFLSICQQPEVNQNGCTQVHQEAIGKGTIAGHMCSDGVHRCSAASSSHCNKTHSLGHEASKAVTERRFLCVRGSPGYSNPDPHSVERLQHAESLQPAAEEQAGYPLALSKSWILTRLVKIPLTHSLRLSSWIHSINYQKTWWHLVNHHASPQAQGNARATMCSLQVPRP